MTEPRKTPRTDAAWLEHISTVSRDTVGFREHARALEIETQELAQELQNIADAKPSEWGDESDQFQAWAQNRACAALARHRAKQEVGT